MNTTLRILAFIALLYEYFTKLLVLRKEHAKIFCRMYDLRMLFFRFMSEGNTV